MREEYTNTIRKVGQFLISLYENSKEVWTGHNGPYDDQETRVRDLSHLIVIASLELLLYQNLNLARTIKLMLDDLLSMKGEDGLYQLRIKPGKDECNGVLGHAWVIEALIYAYKAIGELSCLKEAIRIASMHGFHEGLGLWCRPQRGVDVSAIDYTFNHQLWYAATLMELNEYIDNSTLRKELNMFLNRLDVNFETNRLGRITHSIYNRQGALSLMKQRFKKWVDAINILLDRPSFKYKEEGYHLFNLMAFARLKRLSPSLPFFKTRNFQKAVSFLNSPLFLSGLFDKNVALDGSLKNGIVDQSELEVNIYGFPYNVPGFEIMYVQTVFNTDRNTAEECLSWQHELTFDNESGLFGKRCHDKVTINYRIYEFYRFLEITGPIQ